MRLFHVARSDASNASPWNSRFPSRSPRIRLRRVNLPRCSIERTTAPLNHASHTTTGFRESTMGASRAVPKGENPLASLGQAHRRHLSCSITLGRHLTREATRLSNMTFVPFDMLTACLLQNNCSVLHVNACIRNRTPALQSVSVSVRL